jgi:hypothetical protein
MQEKRVQFNKLWHDDQWVEAHVVGPEAFSYADHIRSLHKFEGTHPAVMRRRVDAMNWTFSFDPSANSWTFKERIKSWIKRLGINPNYQNYRLLKR